MRIHIIGYGYVGKAMARFFKRRYEVSIYDPAQGYNERDNEADLAVICVPTESKEDGSCNTSIVEKTLDEIDNKLVLIKSTVPPNFLKKMSASDRVVFSPEYIGEGKYYTPPWKYPHPTDIEKHHFHIFGGSDKAVSKMIDIFLPITGPHVEFFRYSIIEAGLIKYFENCWNAMKVTWANEMCEVCDNFGVDWNVLREGWAADSRVEKMHTAVFRNKRGYDGKCLPKDVKAFISFCEDRGYTPELMKQVDKSNEKRRKVSK